MLAHSPAAAEPTLTPTILLTPPPARRTGSTLPLLIATAALLLIAAAALLKDRPEAPRLPSGRSGVDAAAPAKLPKPPPPEPSTTPPPLTSPSPTPPTRPPTRSIEYRDGSTWASGLELLRSGDERLILHRDGRLVRLAAAQPPGVYRPIDRPFEPMSATELQRDLRREYGRGYEIVLTDHFVVVQTRGRGDRWSRRFEASHHRFLAAMRSIGAPTQAGRFKMVAVVHPNRRRMQAELQRRGFEVGDVAGLYAQDCNRVFTHDHGDRAYFEETLRHEATHQSAFNSGIHSRVNATPRWITEGLGQWLEVNSSPTSRHRMHIGPNAVSMAVLQRSGCLDDPGTLSRHLASLIRGDRLFRDPATLPLAYAIGWAVTHHLANRHPSRLAALYRHTAARPPLVDYPAETRRADFSAIVDPNVDRYAVSLWRYLGEFR